MLGRTRRGRSLSVDWIEEVEIGGNGGQVTAKEPKWISIIRFRRRYGLHIPTRCRLGSPRSVPSPLKQQATILAYLNRF